MGIYVVKEMTWVENFYKFNELLSNLYFTSEQDAVAFIATYRGAYKGEGTLSSPFTKDGVEYVVEYPDYYTGFDPEFHWKNEGSIWRYVEELVPYVK